MTDSTEALKDRLHTLRGTVCFLLKKADAGGGQLWLNPIDYHSLHDARGDRCVQGRAAGGQGGRR